MNPPRGRQTILSVSLAALFILSFGCAGAAIQGVKLLTKGSPAGVESPEKLAAAVIEAANSQDAEAFGCRLKADSVTVNFRVHVTETVDGSPRERDDTVLLIRTDQGWFLAGMERRVVS